MSNFGGSSSVSDTYLPFFLRCLTHSVSRYSICPFTERKSSSAQAASCSYNFAESLSGICFFGLSSAISVQASRIYNRLCIAVSAEYNKKIGDHGSFSLLIEFYHLILIQTLQCHLNHTDRSVNDHFPRINNR